MFLKLFRFVVFFQARVVELEAQGMGILAFVVYWAFVGLDLLFICT